MSCRAASWWILHAVFLAAWAFSCLGAGAQEPDLVAEALRAARQIEDPQAQVGVLAGVAVASAAADPARAEQTLALALQAVQKIEDPLPRAMAWRTLALRVQEWQPERATGWLATAVDDARSLTYPAQRTLALRELARDLAGPDLARARELVNAAVAAAREVRTPVLRVAALREAAVVLTSMDAAAGDALFRETSRLLRAVISQDQQLELARAELAVAWGPFSLDDALAEAARITDLPVQRECYLRLAETLAVSSPDQALAVAERLSDKGWRARALASIASHLPATQAELAGQLATAALGLGAGLTGEDGEALRALVAQGLARVDLGRSLELVKGLADPDLRAETHAALILRLVTGRPQEALALVRDLDDWLVREPCVAALIPRLGPDQRAAALELARGLRSPRLRAQAFLDLVRK